VAWLKASKKANFAIAKVMNVEEKESDLLKKRPLPQATTNIKRLVYRITTLFVPEAKECGDRLRNGSGGRKAFCRR
jgi:hypothetical protein